ncbi:hemerythrin domain-containing protein [Campylobacter jejuni]|nr:hemerythrin domain-containing protein [Campylobacter jejuni]
MTYNEKIISMNNDLLDHQHKELFEISKKLSLMNQRHVGTKELKIVLRELLIMINRHFSDEEAFMREIEYPYINHHTRIHRKIILEIEEIIISEAKFTEKLNLVVQDFIFKHTAKEDSKIVKYYEEKFKK